MRSLFDRGPIDNYMMPSIIKPVRGLEVPSGGGAVIERTMLNRESRQGGTMRGAGGMGFINRGSSLGTGIDYGTFSGKGAGGARFYGEGVVNLKGGGGGGLGNHPFKISMSTKDKSLNCRVWAESYLADGAIQINGLGQDIFASSLPIRRTVFVFIECGIDEGLNPRRYQITSAYIRVSPTFPGTFRGAGQQTRVRVILGTIAPQPGAPAGSVPSPVITQAVFGNLYPVMMNHLGYPAIMLVPLTAFQLYGSAPYQPAPTFQ